MHHLIILIFLDFEGTVAMIFKLISGTFLSLWMLKDVCGMVSWNKKFNFVADLEIDPVPFLPGSLLLALMLLDTSFMTTILRKQLKSSIVALLFDSDHLSRQ